MQYVSCRFNILFVAFFLVSSAFGQTPDKCRAALYELSLFHVTAFDSKDLTPKPRYAFQKGGDKKDAGLVQYGFESEYTIDEAAPLLEIYGPDPKSADPTLRISEEKWLQLSTQERLDWIKKHVAEKPLHAKDSGLVKLTSVFKNPANTDLQFLPDILVLDSTGNLEIVLPPTDTLENWYSQAQRINARFGAGSMQAMVSGPAHGFFNKGTEKGKNAAVNESLGFFNFIHDYDVVEKLQAGAERFLKDPTKRVANAFNHPYLGPITLAKQVLLKEYVTANAKGEKLDFEKDLKFIRTQDRSFKYIGSTAYRPDVGMPQNRVAMEVRDAHKNLDLLLQRVLRATHELQEGGATHQAFADVQAFDSKKDYEKFPENVRKMLETLFPQKHVDDDDIDEERFAVQMYRNFAYPLRDWSGHLRAFKKPNLNQSVLKAQDTYQKRLTDIESRYRNASIDKEKAAVEVQGALAQFIDESAIGKAFYDWQRLHPTSDKSLNSYLNIVGRKIGPLHEAFPDSLWNGTVDERFQRLQAKYPHNVEIKNSRGKKILVISSYGLEGEKQKALEQDALNAQGRGTVSIGVGKDSNSLRLGSQRVQYGAAGVSNKGMSIVEERVEKLRTLSPVEELRLRHTVAKSIKKNSVLATKDVEAIGKSSEYLVKYTKNPIGVVSVR